MHSMHFHYMGIINHSLSNDEKLHALWECGSECQREVRPYGERAVSAKKLQSQGALVDCAMHPVLGTAKLCG